MTHGSLFSGIGGFDLAAEWLGWTNVFQVEKDPWCRRRLAKNFPDAVRYPDVKTFNGHNYENKIDVISGGFPCQPFSVAGKRGGKADDRYLWDEMFRIITEVKPTFVVGENVTGIITLALDAVLSDLEAAGYTTETGVIPACAAGAWHRRDRVWIMAYADDYGNRRASLQNEGAREEKRLQKRHEMELTREPSGVFAHADGLGWEDGVHGGEPRGETSEFRNACPQQFQDYWATEPRVGRVADGVPNRVDRIKGLGNAIVPQVAYEIFRAIDLAASC